MWARMFFFVFRGKDEQLAETLDSWPLSNTPFASSLFSLRCSFFTDFILQTFIAPLAAAEHTMSASRASTSFSQETPKKRRDSSVLARSRTCSPSRSLQRSRSRTVQAARTRHSSSRQLRRLPRSPEDPRARFHSR